MSKRNQPELPEEADVVVVGSGAAALAAAAALSIKGLDVIILEKADCFGGTTAFSGAAMYLPLTKKAAAAGVHDSRGDVLRYLDNVVGNAAPADLRVAFVDHADEALRFFETGDAAIVRRAGADWLVVDRKRSDIVPQLDSVYRDGRYTLYVVP